jgi:hypothetical protein
MIKCFFFKIKINYLDGNPVLNGNVKVDIFRDIIGRQRIFGRTYSVRNGLIVVVFKNVSHLFKYLSFKVTNLLYSLRAIVFFLKQSSLFGGNKLDFL